MTNETQSQIALSEDAARRAVNFGPDAQGWVYRRRGPRPRGATLDPHDPRTDRTSMIRHLGVCVLMATLLIVGVVMMVEHHYPSGGIILALYVVLGTNRRD